jgi:hypothetical protein
MVSEEGIGFGREHGKLLERDFVDIFYLAEQITKVLDN